MNGPARKRANPFAQLWRPAALLASLICVGSLGYWLLTGGTHSVTDCFYAALVTVTTIGYEDLLQVHTSPVLLGFTAVLAFGGIGVATWSVSMLTGAIVEGDLANYFKERKMEKRAASLSGHAILCGVGETGVHILAEFARAGRPLVVIEHDPDRAAHLREQHPKEIILSGDATDEEMLAAAGLANAAVLIAALHEDRDNMFLVITARTLAPRLIIISKCVDPQRLPRFEKAGANFTVSPNQIGGMRMASQALRPDVVGFLDVMLRAAGDAVRVHQATVSETSPLAGKTLGEARLYETTGVRVIGGITAHGAPPEYNLPDGWRIAPGALLFYIAAKSQSEALQTLAGAAAD